MAIHPHAGYIVAAPRTIQIRWLAFQGADVVRVKMPACGAMVEDACVNVAVTSRRKPIVISGGTTLGSHWNYLGRLLMGVARTTDVVRAVKWQPICHGLIRYGMPGAQAATPTGWVRALIQLVTYPATPTMTIRGMMKPWLSGTLPLA